ncbi:MAG: DUF1801 domain-containing protein [Myxococcota bacterium]
MDIRHVDGFGEGTFDDTLARASADMSAVAHALREVVADVHPGVVEVCWPKQGNAGFGVGPRKMSEQFCYVGAHGKHVNLGFYEGASLPDPAGLLEGTGAKLRHVKVRSVEQARSEAIRALITAAADRLR